MSNNTITNVGSPQRSSDAANRAFVLAAASSTTYRVSIDRSKTDFVCDGQVVAGENFACEIHARDVYDDVAGDEDRARFFKATVTESGSRMGVADQISFHEDEHVFAFSYNATQSGAASVHVRYYYRDVTGGPNPVVVNVLPSAVASATLTCEPFALEAACTVSMFDRFGNPTGDSNLLSGSVTATVDLASQSWSPVLVDVSQGVVTFDWVKALGEAQAPSGNAVIEVGIVGSSSWSGVYTKTHFGPSRIFVTSQTFNGALGGVSGADAKCVAAAIAAEGSGFVPSAGTWVSLVSGVGGDTSSHATYRIDQAGQLIYPVSRVDGTVVSSVDLWSGSLDAPVLTTELDQVASVQVFSNTQTTGEGYRTNLINLCNSWTETTTVFREVGDPSSATGTWIFLSVASPGCNLMRSLYCVEVF